MALTQHTEIEFLVLPVLVSSYLHSELSQPHCWERDVTKPGGREVGNTEEPKPICHSVAGVLTIIGCHHFLIRPVTEKCGNTAAPQKEHPHAHPSITIPSPPCTAHRYSDVCYLCTLVSERDTQTHQMCQKVLRTRSKNKTGLGAQWNVPENTWKEHSGGFSDLWGKKLKLIYRNFLSRLFSHVWRTMVARKCKSHQRITQHKDIIKITNKTAKKLFKKTTWQFRNQNLSE